MRLTKDVLEALLLANEGWETSTHYDSKNFTETRDYKITDGELRVRSRGKTSWADSRFDDSFVVDDEAARRFLRNHLWELETEGVQEAAAAVAAERRAARAAAPKPEAVVPSEPVAGAEDVGVPLGIPARGGHGTTVDRSVDVDKVVRWVGIALAVAPVVVAAAPHVPRLWQERVVPRAKRLRGKFASTQPVEIEVEGEHDPTPNSDQ